MPQYLVYFNQQWVGDHPEDWFVGRGRLVRAVLDEMKAAGAYVFAGGLEENPAAAFSVEPTAQGVHFTDGPFVETKEFLGGFTVVEVADEAAARHWAGKVAEACGWPQEIRRFQPTPPPAPIS